MGQAVGLGLAQLAFNTLWRLRPDIAITVVGCGTAVLVSTNIFMQPESSKCEFKNSSSAVLKNES